MWVRAILAAGLTVFLFASLCRALILALVRVRMWLGLNDPVMAVLVLVVSIIISGIMYGFTVT